MILYIIAPILILVIVIRIARSAATPQEKETQRLMLEAIRLLEENNRLLREQMRKTGPDVEMGGS
ncbi:MAG TPA: hypothetical protein VGJ97_13070 [Anaerolineaceae bacterium]|jgi:5-bromo-4-chloroindolyl phosphate hydrolysis protein